MAENSLLIREYGLRGISPMSLWLMPLILVTFWLGARGLNADPLWGDERLSIYDAGGGPYEPRTLAQIWDGVTARNPWHAPGYFMILSGWGRLVGWQPPALRALSLLIGVLAVAWTYRLGRDMVSPRIGLYAAAVMGTSAFFVHYLHELRMYTLFSVLTAFTLWGYWRIVTARREPGKLLWLGLLAGAVAMLYTHYFASLPLFAIGLYHLLFVKKNRRWWQVVGVMALAGLLFLPWVSSLIAGLGRASSPEAGYVRDSAATTQETLERLAYLFSNGSLLTLGVMGVLSLTARGRGVWQTWFFALSVLVLVLFVNAELRVMTLRRALSPGFMAAVGNAGWAGNCPTETLAMDFVGGTRNLGGHRHRGEFRLEFHQRPHCGRQDLSISLAHCAEYACPAYAAGRCPGVESA